MGGGRALGRGLLAGAALITLLMVLWLVVSGASAGGIVLGLLLLAVIAGPLAGAGWYVLARQPAEEREAAMFASKRRVLNADRVFRQEIGAALRSLAERPDTPRARLLELARGVEAGARGPGAWEDSVQLNDSAIETLRRYDDLVWERVRRLRDGVPAGDVDGVLTDLQRSLDQRQDLLVRGRLAPAIEPTDLLRSEARRAETVDAANVAVGWAVSRNQDDYVVEGVASYFADGKLWKLAHLVPTSSAAQSSWLYVGPAATEVALLEELPWPPMHADSLEVDGNVLPLIASGTAVADVRGGSGSAQGVLVEYRKYQAGGRLGLVEQWPDGQLRGYAGQATGATDIELWPATVAH
jgi:Domain of unknown function (DUF4178)